MPHPFMRSMLREFGLALLVGAGAVAVIAAAPSFIPSAAQDPIVVVENAVQTTDPAADDSPGPVVLDNGLPDGQTRDPPPLLDRDR